MKQIILLTLVFSIHVLIHTQSSADNDKNVVISNSTGEFKFGKGNAEHAMQVKEESRKTYSCNSVRTDIPVCEFYNDIETLDDVFMQVNESSKHGISPKHEYYNSNDIFYSDAHVCYFNLLYMPNINYTN
ncbi:MAG: hypothetical protein ABJB11_17470 [Ferruginibacter sp.]